MSRAVTSIADDLAVFLSGQGLGSYDNGADSTLFLTGLPVDIQNGVTITIVPSPAQNVDMDIREAMVDIMSRNTSGDAGWQALYSIKEVLALKGNFTLSRYYVYSSEVGEIVPFQDPDNQGRTIHRMSCHVIYREITNFIS